MQDTLADVAGVPGALRERLVRLAAPEFSGVRVWALDTTDAGALAQRFAPRLPAGERRTACVGSSRATTRATAAVLARVVLRGLAARPDTPLLRGAHGRPRWVGGPSFSVAYAGPLALIAIADDDDDDVGTVGVGVDVEDGLPGGSEPLALAAAAGFHAREREAIASAASSAERDACFLRLWTLKEALAKAAGGGIGSPAWFLPLRCAAEAQAVGGAGGRGVVVALAGLPGRPAAVARWYATAAGGGRQAAALAAGTRSSTSPAPGTAAGGQARRSTYSGGQMSR